jgi:hypothetical protein
VADDVAAVTKKRRDPEECRKGPNARIVVVLLSLRTVYPNE